MSGASEDHQRQLERGWGGSDDFVCVRCVSEEFLKAEIGRAAVSRKCSFCGRQSRRRPIAADLEVLLELIGGAVDYYFERANDVLYYADTASWEAAFDKRDVMEHLIQQVVADEVFEAIVEAFEDDQWVKRPFAALPRDRVLSLGWETFCVRVRTTSRFLFLLDDQEENPYVDADTIRPSEMLDELGRSVEMVEAMLVTLPRGHEVFRGRVHLASETVENAAQLGSPPPDKATAGRMNPGGISFFYGAFEHPTAVAEMESFHAEASSILTVGRFSLARDCWVLDLTALPEWPSDFDADRRHLQDFIAFLSEFTESISKPVARDGSEHIEYVPSQIVTEYFRLAYGRRLGTTLDGVVYPSARAKGGKCVVLFAGPAQCCDEGAANDASVCVLRPNTLSEYRLKWIESIT